IISAKLATLLSKLDVKPVEAGISLDSAVAEGIIYAKDEMVIDVEKYRSAFAQAYQEALALSMEIGYITKENITLLLAKVAQGARSVAVEAGYLTDETKEQVLQKAHAQARAVASKAKNYTPL
ncbi:MAG: 50S ribosomal protein L10, partial [Thermoproteota archaeon]